MEYAYTLDDIQDLAKSQLMTLLYFTRAECDICAELQPKIERLVQNHPKMSGMVVSLDRIPMAASRFSVFVLPSVLIYAGGKPVISVSEHIDIGQLTSHVRAAYRDMFFPD
ncbi:thioredoxin family protein [Salinispira pacifica]